VFKGDWEQDVYGLRPGRYFASLFNMEGILLRQELLDGDMLAAGLLLVLQDVTKDVWFPTSTMFAEKMTSALTPKQAAAVEGKRFLAVPCLVGGNHWVACIYDRKSKVAYWFNSLTCCTDEFAREDFARWLSEHDIEKGQIVHQTVVCEQQASSWECGLLVLENIRQFFREPSIEDRTGIKNWGLSRLFKHSLPVVGQLDTVEKKTAWLIMVYVGWVRSELGSDTFTELRVPMDPVLSLDAFHELTSDRTAPNGFHDRLEDKTTAEEFVAQRMGSDILTTDPHLQPTKVLTYEQVGKAFNIWVSGELGLFFWPFLGQLNGSWTYKSYLNAPDEPPREDAIPRPIPVKGYVGSDAGIDEELNSDPDYSEGWVDELTTEEGVAAWLAEAEAEAHPNGSPATDKAAAKNEDQGKRKHNGDGARTQKKRKTTPAKPKIYKLGARVKLNKGAKDKKRVRAGDKTDTRSERWEKAFQERGRMLGRPLYDHSHSPIENLSPTHDQDWRGWPVERALDNKDRLEQNAQ
jgi:hypothetical protein